MDGIVRNIEVQIAIIIRVKDKDAEARSGSFGHQPGLLRDVRKNSVAVVAIKNVVLVLLKARVTAARISFAAFFVAA